MKTAVHKRFSRMVVAGASMLLSAWGALADEPVVYDFTDCYSPYLTSQEVVVWANRSIADILSVTATIKGGWISTPKSGKAVIYDRTDTSFKAQLQCLDGNCKAVRAYFREEGSDIVAFADRAGYGDADMFGTLMPDSLFVRELSTDGSDGAYGAHDLEAFGDVRQTVDSLPETDAGIVVKGGTLQVNVNSDMTVSSSVSGSGALRFHSEEGGLIHDDMKVEGYLSGQDMKVAAYADLSTLTVTRGYMRGGWCGGPYETDICNVKYNAEAGTLDVQFQYFNAGNNSLRGLAVQFMQKGTDIYARVVKAAQCSSADARGSLGSDMFGDRWPASSTYIATSDTGNGYGIRDIEFDCDRYVSAILSGTKSWTGGTVIDGARVSVSDSRLANSTDVWVLNGGILTLNAKGAFELNSKCNYHVGSGSQLIPNNGFALTFGDSVVLDGGLLYLPTDCNIYMDNLTLKNGGQAQGAAMRVGMNADANWQTEGSDEICIDMLIYTSNRGRTFTLNTAADIVFTKLVNELSGYLGMKFKKCGSAKATFEKGVSSTGEAILSGGSLVFGENTKFGALTLGADTSVSVASGKTLEFADSSAAAWESGPRLNLSGSVRFGTSDTALTRAQIRSIRMDGEKVHLDQDGWVVKGGNGMVLIIK